MQQKRAILIAAAAAALVAAAWLALGERAQAGLAYAVSDDVGGSVWRMEDLNGDGDALDVGERTLWAQGSVALRGAAFDGAALYAYETLSHRLVRLVDNNGDRDALDLGEESVWLDGLGVLFIFDDLARDPHGISYLTDSRDDRILRLVDTNNDGDVLDIGESSVFIDGFSSAQRILAQNDALIAARDLSLPERIVMHRLEDLNGDGDALDVGEDLPITPDLAGRVGGLLDDGAGGFYFSSVTDNTVYHAIDLNGDGDMLDVGEVLSYADSVYGQFDSPQGMAPYVGGGFLLADTNHDQVKLARDLNGDGDALDIGEVVVFADGFIRPTNIVAMRFGLPGDYNGDGFVDAADYTNWRDNLGGDAAAAFAPGTRGSGISGPVSQDDYAFWKTHFGETAGSGSGVGSNAVVPEPGTVGLLVAAFVALVFVRRR